MYLQQGAKKSIEVVKTIEIEQKKETEQPKQVQQSELKPKQKNTPKTPIPKTKKNNKQKPVNDGFQLSLFDAFGEPQITPELTQTQ